MSMRSCAVQAHVHKNFLWCDTWVTSIADTWYMTTRCLHPSLSQQPQGWHPHQLITAAQLGLLLRELPHHRPAPGGQHQAHTG
jgi:hypothetical protein